MNSPSSNVDSPARGRGDARGRIAPTALLAVLIACAGSGCREPIVAAPGPLSNVHLLTPPGDDCLAVRRCLVTVIAARPELRRAAHQSAELLAAALRAEAPVDAVVVSATELCGEPAPSCDQLRQSAVCQAACQRGGAALVLCELQQFEAYPPLRLGLGVRVIDMETGRELAAVQGIWTGPSEPVSQPPRRRRGRRRQALQPPPQDISRQLIESLSPQELQRTAAREIAQSLMIGLAAGNQRMPSDGASPAPLLGTSAVAAPGGILEPPRGEWPAPPLGVSAAIDEQLAPPPLPGAPGEADSGSLDTAALATSSQQDSMSPGAVRGPSAAASSAAQDNRRIDGPAPRVPIPASTFPEAPDEPVAPLGFPEPPPEWWGP